MNLLNRTFDLEDRIDAKRRRTGTINWEFRPKREGRFASILDNLGERCRRGFPDLPTDRLSEYIFFVYLHRPLFIFLAFLCLCMGLIIVWSEEVRRWCQTDIHDISLTCQTDMLTDVQSDGVLWHQDGVVHLRTHAETGRPPLRHTGDLNVTQSRQLT